MLFVCQLQWSLKKYEFELNQQSQQPIKCKSFKQSIEIKESLSIAKVAKLAIAKKAESTENHKIRSIIFV